MERKFKKGDEVNIIGDRKEMAEFGILKEYRPDMPFSISDYREYEGKMIYRIDSIWFRESFLEFANKMENIEFVNIFMKDLEVLVDEDGAFINYQGHKLLIAGKVYSVLNEAGTTPVTQGLKEWNRGEITVKIVTWRKE